MQTRKGLPCGVCDVVVRASVAAVKVVSGTSGRLMQVLGSVCSYLLWSNVDIAILLCWTRVCHLPRRPRPMRLTVFSEGRVRRRERRRVETSFPRRSNGVR